ncbi:MAG: LysR family transcriptional regulator [Boseongicola sp.]|nr:LysR family transcriptional regulator [Boseongicola sp.]
MTHSKWVTLKQLRYFTRIVEFGSISRASQDLNIAQTALGLQVRALEESLGARLLLRHPKGVRATEKGQFVYDRSIAILRDVDDMNEQLQNWSDEKPRDIWLGLDASLIGAIGTQVLVKQDSCIPGFHLHLLEGPRDELIEDVQNGSLDWAIVHEAKNVMACRTTPVLRQSVQLICRPGTALPHGPVSLREVLACDLVLDSGRQAISGVLATAAKTLGLMPEARYEVDSFSTIKQMILTEGVCGVFSQMIVRDEIERGELEAHQIGEPPLEITAYFVCRLQASPREQELPVLQFIDQLLDEFVAESSGNEVRLGHLASVVHPKSAQALSALVPD